MSTSLLLGSKTQDNTVNDSGVTAMTQDNTVDGSGVTAMTYDITVDGSGCDSDDTRQYS